MKKKLLLSLFLVPFLFLKAQNQFIVGVNWLTPHDNNHIYTETTTPLSDAYWDLAQDLGINYAEFPVGEYTINTTSMRARIQTELTKAAARNIKLLLANGITDYGKEKRWVRQVEGTYDFNYNIGISNAIDNDAAYHWTAQSGAYNCLDCSGSGGGVQAQNLKEKIALPLGYDYYFVIKVKKLENINNSDNLAVVRLINTADNSTYKTYSLPSSSVPYNTWSEYSFPSFYLSGSGTLSLDISIEAPDLMPCKIDYVAIDNYNGHRLMTGALDAGITATVNNYKTYSGLGDFKIYDEAEPETYPTIAYKIKKIAQILNGTGYENLRAISYLYPPTTNPERFLIETGSEVVWVDEYPFDLGLRTPDATADYLNAIQNIWNTSADHHITKIAAANKYGIPYIFIPQAHSWTNLREPSAYEIRGQVGLALCYGAKGIQYFMFAKPWINRSAGTYYGEGLISSEDQTNPQPRTYDAYGYPKWETIRNLNTFLNNVGGELMSLKWKNAYSIHEGQPSGQVISSVIAQNDAVTYAELGLFKKQGQETNPNLDYFIVMNRRVYQNDTRNITITINKASSISSTWLVTELGNPDNWVISKTGSFTASFAPGEAKVFKMEPVTPAAPQNLRLTAPTGGVKRLTWDANTEPNISNYEIYKKTSAGATNWTLLSAPTENMYDFYAPNTFDYVYKVRAKNTLGIYSAFSSEVSQNMAKSSADFEDAGNSDNFIPEKYAVLQNYPNPFNPSTTITYDIPEASKVTLKVYDILGREIAELVNEFKEAGRYSVRFDASQLSTGIYIYKLIANDYTATKKMNFVK